MTIDIVNPGSAPQEDTPRADFPATGALAATPRGKPRGTTGPTTDAGKAIVARNATRHAIFAAHLVDGVETAADWDSHHAGILDSLAPHTPLELDLADRVALLLWRLRRVTRYEAQAISSHVAQAEADAAVKLDEELSDTRPPYDEFERFRYLTADAAALRAAHQDLVRAVAALDSLPSLKDGVTIPEETVFPMLRAVARAAHHADGGDRFQDVCRLALATAQEWTRPRLVRAFDSFATPGPNKPAIQDLIGRAHRVARRELEYAAGLVARLDAAAGTLRRARILPPAKPLDRVMKYEAHLSRLLLATLHELEALQRRRQGDPTPLARLSVSTDSESALPWLRSET